MATDNVAHLAQVREQLDKEAARPTIELLAGELATAVAESERALITGNAGIYQRGGQLVRIAQLQTASIDKASGIKRAAGMPVILPVSKDFLLLTLSTHARFERFDARKKGFRDVDPPGAVAAQLLAAAGQWISPELRGIVSAPTLRPDGTLLAASGYDAASGLLRWDDGTQWPEIPARPSREAAMEALDTLRELLTEFEFEGGAHGTHAAAALAAIVTACIRHALPTAPGYGLNAHKAGSGKTTLGHTIARIPTGRDAAVMPLADEETEVRKTILSVLMAADLIVLIDNIAAPVDSAALCAALTSLVYKDRVLGESRTVSLPTSVTWLMNGNNLEFVGDLTSRVLLSTLDPQCEQPEARAFRRDIAAYVIQHRGALVRAVLTLPLAYLAAGEPDIPGPRSRFAEWDRFVRRPLLWLGCADPLDTQETLRGVDPIRGALVAMLNAWEEAFGSEPTTVAKAIEATNAAGMSEHPRLYEALIDAAGERNGTVNAKRLGRWLVRHARRIETGRRFEDMGPDPRTSRKRFRVASVTRVSSVTANPIVGNGSVNHMEVAKANTDNADNKDSDCVKCEGEGCGWCQ